ncbi:hypothetical protein GLOTRDRAFT_120887 [Gloeophyllum trabeum ATCC 11539]|uniref:AB hydrolase-1 domain-containing protein n=1 Tax=Gloeophyllum trabeum (strain ATCC 11539 / FP-39264 / Madison 617) TaxID=670483 RepID=S7QA00_GLOTA|nr:uncharacterized protein GLOTRDRAFT_120887 [Gloeophyllum trabeum ATCC 11539]EPQ56342.1 hypothetical protein GLOTRDRAFT_120887 [Gloeophyllum trabeum ATCC 11539]
MISEPVNDKAVQFFYEDSGAPHDGTYTTLLIIHGTSYHSAVFHRLLPLAPQHSLRLVLLNRRDYPGSTRISPKEIVQIRSPRVDEQAAALRGLGLDIASFLAWYARSSGIPKVGADGSGGISVLAWSSGNAQTSAAIANLGLLEEDKKALLRDYLRGYIIYDSPSYVFGFVQPPDLYNVFRDPSIPSMAQKAAVFNIWVTGYYQHPDPESGCVAGLATRSLDNPSPTYHRLDAAVSDPEALQRGEGFVRYMGAEVFRENFERIFTDKREAEGFPGLKVKLVWCRQTNPDIVWGAAQLRKKIEEMEMEGKTYRKLEVHSMNGNHFAHWDQPEDTIQFWSTLV